MITKLTLKQKIEKCRNSRTAGKRAKTPPELCHSDWCTHCSRAKTKDMLWETLRILDSSPTYTLTTILLGAVTSYKQGLNMAKAAVARMAKGGITGVGSMEIGNRKDSKGFDNFNQVFPIDETRDEGIAHLHFISPQSYPILKAMFPIKRQVLQKQLGLGVYENVSYNQNVAMSVSYCRKKKDAFNAWWFSQVSGTQYVYRMFEGVVSVLNNGYWQGCVVGVSEGGGDGFVNVSGVLGSVSCSQLSHTRSDDDTLKATRSLNDNTKPETINVKPTPELSKARTILERLKAERAAKQGTVVTAPPINPDKHAEARDALFDFDVNRARSLAGTSTS